MIQDIKLYILNFTALMISSLPNLNTWLQTIVLILTIIYTLTKIYKQHK